VFGQLIFAELPFASIGQPPYLEHGWIKDCAKPTGWEKQDKEKTDWAVVDRSATDWQKQDRNDVNTIGCGYIPSNLGGNQ
jgi:hypothetical protein